MSSRSSERNVCVKKIDAAIRPYAVPLIMGAPNNATYYNPLGKVHPTLAGYALLEPITRAAINSL